MLGNNGNGVRFAIKLANQIGVGYLGHRRLSHLLVASEEVLGLFKIFQHDNGHSTAFSEAFGSPFTGRRHAWAGAP